MKRIKFFLLAAWLAAAATPAWAHSPGRHAGETLLLIPSRGAALIVLENANRFDPWVQRLLAEGDVNAGSSSSSR